MKLYFLRHATAARDAASDELRELTEVGRIEARTAGDALARMGVKPGAILTSPLVRARQTAELAAQALNISDEITVVAELANDATTAQLLKALKPFTAHAELVLVGHLPSFPEYIATLTGSASPNALHLGKGAIACVQLNSLTPGGGTLRWLMGKKQLGLI